MLMEGHHTSNGTRRLWPRGKGAMYLLADPTSGHGVFFTDEEGTECHTTCFTAYVAESTGSSRNATSIQVEQSVATGGRAGDARPVLHPGRPWGADL